MPLSRLDHLLVLSDDMDGTRDFYRDVLGMEVGERPPLEFAGYWLYVEGVPCVHVADRAEFEAHSEQVGIPASRAAAGTGALDHVAFAGSGYDEMLARVRAAGIEPGENLIPAVGIRQLFFQDPNGVKIEINVAPE